MNLRVRSVTCWSAMVTIVDGVDINQQKFLCKLDEASQIVGVVAACEQQDRIAVKCGSEFTSAVSCLDESVS
jgi:hypothetical protein